MLNDTSEYQALAQEKAFEKAFMWPPPIIVF
jgi:hypothetical protein